MPMNINFDALVTARRSIRKYTDEKISEPHILDMVTSAGNAPSPSNSQPVRYLHLVSSESRQGIFKNMETGYQNMLTQAQSLEKPRKAINILNHYWRYSRFMFHAPALFAVGVEKQGDSFSGRLKRAGLMGGKDLETMGCDISLGLSLQFFMLKAVELGLGTCILTAPLHFLEMGITIPGTENLSIRCFVTAGFPDECPAAPERKQPMEIYRKV
jgi:nitroreductase